MHINVIDASNYFKGLLLLIRKDREISGPEIELMKRIGKSLGFEKEFCENAIREILENQFIEDVPPEFPNRELARMFIKDGLTLANSDNEIHLLEEEWLKSTVQKNGLDLKWFHQEKEKANTSRTSSIHLEIDNLTIGH